VCKPLTSGQSLAAASWLLSAELKCSAAAVAGGAAAFLSAAVLPPVMAVDATGSGATMNFWIIVIGCFVAATV
jgi:hypothetical protein